MMRLVNENDLAFRVGMERYTDDPGCEFVLDEVFDIGRPDKPEEDCWVYRLSRNFGSGKILVADFRSTERIDHDLYERAFLPLKNAIQHRMREDTK